jgi:hypothetical protein
MRDKHGMDPNYNYHFSRDEYEKSRHLKHLDFKGGPFKQNRSLLITLLDISVIVLIIMVVLPFIRKSNEVPDLNGYKLQLTHYRTEEEIFLNLLITNKTKEEVDGAALTDIEFSLENSDNTIYINDLLPLPGESLTYRISMKDDGSETATAKVSIDGESTILNVKVSRKED